MMRGSAAPWKSARQPYAVALQSDVRLDSPLQTSGWRGRAVVRNEHAVKAGRSGASRRTAGAIAPLSAVFQRLGADTVQKVLLPAH